MVNQLSNAESNFSLNNNPNFLECIPEACLILSGAHTILFDNTKAQQLYESTITLKDSSFKNFLPKDPSKNYSTLKEIFNESEHITLEGKKLYVKVKSNSIIINKEQCYLLLIEDLSEVKNNRFKIENLINETHLLSDEILKVQTELLQKEKKLASLIHSQLNFLIRIDTKGNITFANKSFLKLFQPETKFIEDVNLKSLIYHQDLAIWQTTVIKCLKNPYKPITVPLRMLLSREKITYIEWEFYGIISDESQAIEIQCIGKDITDKKKTELELQKTLHLFGHVFNQSSDALFLVDDYSSKIIDCNQKTIDLFEFEKKEDLIGLIGYDFEVKTPNHESFDSLKKRLSKTSIQRIVQYKTNKGNFFWGDVAAKNTPINDYNIRLVRITDITDRIEKEEKISSLLNATLSVNQELQSKNSELNKTNKELDYFVYRISHDLRAPIASTLGLINLIKTENDRNNSKEYLGYIEKSMLKLDELIKNILDYSKNNRLEVHKEHINLRNLIESLISQFQLTIEEKNIQLINELTDEVLIHSDYRRITVIMNNLISNAIRYHNPYEQDKYIKIDWERYENEYIISIADNGIGIPNKFHNDIFKMFFRVDNRGVSGSGIGLYIVKETLEKLKGKIDLRSIERKGTTFYVTLPMQ